ncbi:MAG: tripartite tricarboxylate transporter substrate binding protein [Rhodoferax sp.]
MINRRIFTRLGLAGLSSLGLSGAAFAQAYPNKPIKLIVGFPAGQASDSVARMIALKMSEELKQNVWVDNKPGAAGIISHDAARLSPPDGYTLLVGSTTTLALNPTLYTKLSYNPARDFDAVALMMVGPMYLFAAANSPVNNVKEMIAYVKARPGKVAYGSSGNGLTNHVTMEMLKSATGMDMLHVPYKGSPPMIVDLIGGRVDFAFEPSASILPMVKGGRVKLLGVTSLKREAVTPDIPTITEQGVAGFEANVWSSIVAPKGTPPAFIQVLNAAVIKALQSEAVQAEMKNIGAAPLLASPAEADAFMRRESTRWGKVVKDIGVQLD